MTPSIHDKVKRTLLAAEALYYRLVLLVGMSGTGKTCVLQDVASFFDTSIVNLNLSISVQLLELTAKQRPLRLPEIFDLITDKPKSLVVLDNIEILFDISLKQDPLRLLQRFSRNRTVVASWNGIYTGGKLTYAEVGHPEHRSYDSVDALIVNMDGSATVDSAKQNIAAGQL